MIYLMILMRWLHIFPALAIVGGLLYLRFVRPQALAADFSAEGESPDRRRFALLVMISTALLLLSGLVNFFILVRNYELGEEFPGNLYHMLFGIKFLLALAVFFFAARLAGRSDGAAKMRSSGSLWLNLTLGLALAVVALGGVMRMAQREPKAVEAAIERSSASSTPIAASR